MSESNYTRELVNFIANNGFMWGPEPEIYGGLSGFYTYGPLGKLLKNNVENAMRKVFQKNNFWEVECPTIMPSSVWKASGHLGGFTDPLIKCTKCESEFRVDKLIEEKNPEIQAGALPKEKLLELIEKNEIKCTSCEGELGKEIIEHSLMMKTTIGVDTEAYNRPETATTTYLPFKRYDEFFRTKFPFGVFQIGKAYRNEISPRQHVMRGREFTQAEAQIFILKDQKNSYDKYEEIKSNELPLWGHKDQSDNKEVGFTKLSDALEKGLIKSQVYAYSLALAYDLFIEMGIPKENIRFRQHTPDEMAFYADDAWDIEVKLNSFGWYELCGVHDRTNYDLTQHAKFSKQKLEVHNEETKEKEVPNIIEIAFGSDRPTFALLDIFYSDDGKRKIFKIPTSLAPIKVAVFPLMKKEPLANLAKEIYEEVLECYHCVYDETGSIGKRYARMDEKGTPFCITVDYDSIDNKDVTIRERDSAEQKRIKKEDLKDVLYKLVTGTQLKDI